MSDIRSGAAAFAARTKPPLSATIPPVKKAKKNKNNGTNRGKRFVDRKRGVSEKKGSKQGELTGRRRGGMQV